MPTSHEPSIAPVEPSGPIDASDDDLFPEVRRYLYGHPPAKEVICQIRFPQILKIASELPADFQERIRHEFPIATRGADLQASGMPQELIQLITAGQPNQPFVFSSEDASDKLTISVDSLSIVTTNYKRWERFDRLRVQAFEALIDIYRPSFISRTGLRFINVIDRTSLDEKDLSWRELINNSLLGEINELSDRGNIIEAGRLTRIEHILGNVCLQHGFAVNDGKANPNSYILDADFYSDGKQSNDSVGAVIQRFHARARRLFGWATSDKLRELLRPTPCDD